ncbi:hypothetical protein DYI25_19860 [Mesobacillus boroniphilus]|uniref:Uncharacterized protein n=1 Tax=Mesobacillus boroniphilus TaxID=308892 RepID=A0A944CP26_9BACI|nr:hypothetical protein [Mesobacillus boroniphilus]MBS8266684.1 hypothetical protein [Mesobacillus boroniphilus]
MKKLTVSVLSLFILLILSHGTIPDEKIHADTQSKIILPLDQIQENLPGPDSDDKKSPFVLSTFVLFTLTAFYMLYNSRTDKITGLFSFLTAVFFQSNYVIKPL